MVTDVDVVIVGAGFAGLTMAARCQALGLRVRVVERSTGPRTTGAGIMLHPNALGGLAHLRDRLADAGRPIEHQLTWDADGSVGRLAWSDVWPRGVLPIAIERRTLAGLMLDHLEPSVVGWGLRPLRLEQNADAVLVRLSDGSAINGRLVIGADGVHSWVRRRIDPEQAPRALGQTFWRTTVAEEDPFAFPEWRVWRGAGHFFGGMPIGRGRMHVFVQSSVADPGRADQRAVRADMEALVAEIGPNAHRVFRGLRLDREVDVRTVYGVSASRWTDRRVAVIGDAAHAVSPATTQGGGLALGDTAVLAEAIAEHGVGAEALTAFASRRFPQVARFVRRARLHSELITAVQGRPAGRRGAPAADATAWFRHLYQPLMSEVGG